MLNTRFASLLLLAICCTIPYTFAFAEDSTLSGSAMSPEMAATLSGGSPADSTISALEDSVDDYAAESADVYAESPNNSAPFDPDVYSKNSGIPAVPRDDAYVERSAASSVSDVYESAAEMLLNANPELKKTLAIKTLKRIVELEKLYREPVTIQVGIQSTFEHHKSLRVIQENRKALRYDVRRAKAGWGPSLDLAANATSAQTNNTINRNFGIQNDFADSTGDSATLTQPLWDGLATYSRVASAQASVNSLENRVIDTGTSLALDTLIAHLDVIRRREVFQLSVRNVQRHKDSLEIARTRAELGLDTDADVSQADGRYARALSALSETNATLIASQDLYARLTGLSTGSALAPIDMPEEIYKDVTMALTQAMQTNPKWLAYRYDIVATRADRKLMQAAFQPTINLSVSPNYRDDDGDWSHGLNFGASMSWNVFNSGADIAAVSAASARVRESTQFREDFWDTLTLEMQTAWTEWKSAVEQQRYYEEAQVYNQQTLQAYQEQFNMGSRPILDVLDAESELYNTSVSAITSASNAKINAYKLYALSGVLLERLGVDTRILTEDAR